MTRDEVARMSDSELEHAVFSLLTGLHNHRCPSCGTVWEHKDNCAQASEAVYQQSHTCPQCGRPGVIQKYYGDQPANAIQICTPHGVELRFK